MKKYWTSITAAAFLLLIGSSCTVQEERGTLRLGIQQNGSETMKAALADGRIDAALVTIVGEDGQLIYDKERLYLYSFGEGFTTPGLELPEGNFQLDEFMLIDSAGVVRWATPRNGSGLAHLVSKPLPVMFGIIAGETTTVSIEVVRTLDYQPSDFGYASFDIGFVERFCLQVYYQSRCLDDWNDSILGPDGSGAPVYMPMLSIWSRDRRILREPLDPGLNRYQLPLLEDLYYLEATDCRGQVVYRQRMGLDQLLEYPCRDDAPALLIERDSVPSIPVTPEGLAEPTISQGVFGQLTLGLDDFMLIDSTDQISLIRDIYFYPYTVLDSFYTMGMGPIDCHFPAQMLGTEPVAAVRTNSEGTYQIRLPEGEYLCLVEDGEQYFLDRFGNSDRPGYVRVFRDSVTYHYINLFDCSMWM